MVTAMNILSIPQEVSFKKQILEKYSNTSMFLFQIQLQILDFLDFRNRVAASRVCRLWNVLAFCGHFMDRICLRLNIADSRSEQLMTTVENNGRRYRHIVMNFNNNAISTINSVAEMLGFIDSVESLELTGILNIEPNQVLSILANTPALSQLCISEDGYNPPANSTSNPPWFECFSDTSPFSLQLVRKLRLVFPRINKPVLESITQIFPNLTQLELSGNDSSIASVFHAYRDQLEHISILAPYRDFFLLFCDIEFKQLSQLYLDQIELHDQHAVEKCTRFFVNPTHSVTLQQLIFHPRFMIRTVIFITICHNCSVLQELELSLDYMNGVALKEITNLKFLQVHQTIIQ